MSQIRSIAICILSRNGKIPVGEGYDPAKDEIFYRPLGGGIEFGECSVVKRKPEFRGASVRSLP